MSNSSLPDVVLQWLASHSLGGTEWGIVPELIDISVKSLDKLVFIDVEDLASCSTIVKRRLTRANSVHG